MYQRLLKAVVAIALLASIATHAQADTIAGYGARTPAIAIDPTLDRGLAVYEDGGRIYGTFVDNTGRRVAGGGFLIFPQSPASNSKYRDPVIVFKSAQRRFYIAARQSYPSRFNLPDGPLTIDTADGIAVTAYDALGTRVATRTLYTPGLARNAFTSDAEARPAIVADWFANNACCVVVAWEDARAPGQLHLARHSADLALLGGDPLSLATSAARVSNLSAAYDTVRDRFLFAYDACASSGRACAPVVLSFARTTATIGAVSNFALPSRPGLAGDPAYPSIAWVPVGNQHVVSWNWRTTALPGAPADAGTAVTTVSFVSGTVGTMTARTPLWNTRPGTWPALKGPVHVVALGSTPRAMIVAPTVAGATGQFLAGYIFDAPTFSMISARRFSMDAAYIPSGRAAYSPTGGGRVTATWQHDILVPPYDAGVWAFPVGLPP